MLKTTFILLLTCLTSILLSQPHEEYLKEQLKFQYQEEKISTYQRELDFKPFEKALINFHKRYLSIQDKILDKSIAELQEQIRNKDYSYKELTLFYLYRIKMYDQKFNSIISLNPKVLKEAERYDNLLANGEVKAKGLTGIPLLLKDNISVKDMQNSAGTYCFKDFTMTQDAPVTQKLKNFGAIVLGKTNLSEWANFMSYPSSNGFSVVGGQTKNPYGNFDVGGSSSGSAVATALNFAAATLGTETSGSLIYPSSQNNILGLKPTHGLVSSKLIVPISESQDTAGPMSKSASDGVLLLTAMIDDEKVKKELQDIDFKLEKFSSLKIVLAQSSDLDNWYRKDDKELLKKISKQLNKLGANIIKLEVDTVLSHQIIGFPVMLQEFKEGVNSYLTESGISKEITSLSEIIEKNKKDTLTNPYNQLLLKMANDQNMSHKDFTALRKKNQELSRKILDKLLKDQDCILTLSNYLSNFYSKAGYPAITIPAGFRKNGEPIGFTLITRANEDAKLYQIAVTYLAHFKTRKTPIIND